MLRINVPVSKANALLSANFMEFEDKKSGTTLVRTLSVMIPDDIEPHLQFIYPTTQYAPHDLCRRGTNEGLIGLLCP